MKRAMKHFTAEAQMKRFNDPPKSFVSAEEWYRLACAEFPELEFESFDDDVLVWSACEGLAYAADAAHQDPENTAFLTRCYGFIRWSIRHTHDAQLKGWIGDWFFGELLCLPHSKTGCIDYLDWGDVRMLAAALSVDPPLGDEANFANLCHVWQKRWVRNQKLHAPAEPRTRAD